MTWWTRTVSAVAYLAMGVTMGGCSDEVCDEATVDRATAFIDTHQSCEVDADCIVMSDYCATIPGGWCGQITMSRAGKESAEWRSIAAELEGCSPEECSTCAGAMIPTCTAGSCGGRR